MINRPKLSLRINGTRIGDSARPEATDVVPARPLRAAAIRRGLPPLVIRDYRDGLDDDGVAS